MSIENETLNTSAILISTVDYNNNNEIFYLNHSYVYGLTIPLIFLTIAGNGIILITIRFQARLLSSTSNYFILSLALADFFVGLIIMPIMFLYTINDQKWKYSLVLCDLWMSIDFACSSASFLTLSAMSIERYKMLTTSYVHIRHSSKLRIIIFIILSWLLPFVSWIPVIVVYRYFTASGSLTSNLNEQDCSVPANKYVILAFCILLYHIPLICMVTFYSKLIIHIKKSFNKNFDSTIMSDDTFSFSTLNNNSQNFRNSNWKIKNDGIALVGLMSDHNRNSNDNKLRKRSLVVVSQNGQASKNLFFTKLVKILACFKSDEKINKTFSLSVVGCGASAGATSPKTNNPTKRKRTLSSSLILNHRNVHNTNRSKATSMFTKLKSSQKNPANDKKIHAKSLNNLNPKISQSCRIINNNNNSNNHIESCESYRKMSCSNNYYYYNNNTNIRKSSLNYEPGVNAFHFRSSLANNNNTNQSNNSSKNLSNSKVNFFLLDDHPKSASTSRPHYNHYLMRCSIQTTASTIANTQINKDSLIDTNDYRAIRLKRNRKAARMLGLIIVSFSVCWLPFTVMYPLSHFYPELLPRDLTPIVWWLGYLNSTINPFLYVYCNKNIRRSVRILFYDRIKSFFCGSNGTNKRFRTDSFRNNLYLQHQQQNNHNYYAKQNCIDQNCNDHDGPNANYNNQNLHTNNNNNNRYCKKNSLRQIRLK